MNINWYPGHMVKAKNNIIKSLKLVDIVAEIIDSRIPVSSRNPMLDQIIGDKPRIIIMNKSDLSEENENEKWISYFNSQNIRAIKINSKNKINTSKIYSTAKEQLKDEFSTRKEKGIDKKLIKMMIVGIPNSGKSTFINNISEKKGTKIGNRPGVTKQNQWIKTSSNLYLLDTPGVLWPKFEDQKTALHLSYTNAIKDEILVIEDLALEFIKEMKKLKPQALEERYGIDINDTPLQIYESIALKRGAIMKNKEIDYTKAANIILNDFRTGKLGKISLEKI